MKHRNQMKRTYRSPLSSPTEVAFEQSLLVATVRMLLRVDESDNVNDNAEGIDEAGGELYFEF